MSNEIRIEYIALSQIAKHPRNPKDHDRGAIAKSISRFGYVAPILIDERSGYIVAGHGRLDTLLDMKAKGEVAPARIQVDDNGAWLVPVMRGVSFNSDAEVEAYLVADNRLTELGGWHDAELAGLLQDLALQDMALLEATGFDGDDLDALLADLGMRADPTPDPGAQVDRAAELQQKWQTERGQLWQVGRHRILCGDSTDADDVARLMDFAQIEMIWTDPPYGVAVGDKNKLLNAIGTFANRVEKNLVNDTLDEPELMDMLVGSFDNAISHCLAGAAWYVAAPPGPLHILFGTVLKERGIWRQTIQWVKNNATFSPMGVDYHWQAEPIFYGWLPNAGHRYYGGRTQTTVWEIDRPTKSPEHPTMKPVELVARAVENSTKLGEYVYDPFLGSGTTIVACEQTGRVGYGMEIDPGYVAVTLERLVAMGLEAELQ